MGWMTSNHMSKVGSIAMGLLSFPIMMLYIALLIYLTIKTETVPIVSPDFGMSTSTTDATEVERGSELHHIQNVHEIEIDIART